MRLELGQGGLEVADLGLERVPKMVSLDARARGGTMVQLTWYSKRSICQPFLASFSCLSSRRMTKSLSSEASLGKENEFEKSEAPVEDASDQPEAKLLADGLGRDECTDPGERNDEG